jgi:plastocyanin
MRAFVTAWAALALGVVMSGCGGGGGYSTGGSGSPADPTPPSASGVVTVDVVAMNGAQSFSPNPATLPPGQRIVWHNVDTITHRVVLNDGTLDTGNLAPGASSVPMALAGAGASYHCSIHPSMVGSINQATANPGTCQGAYCD